jgi:hypothetical protein
MSRYLLVVGVLAWVGFATFAVWKLLVRKRSPPHDRSTNSTDDRDGAFFAALLSQYLAQDALHWTHVSTLSIVQGATLAGTYALWSDGQVELSVIFDALGFVLTVALMLVIVRTREVRDANLDILNDLGKRLDSRWQLPVSTKRVKVTGDQVLAVVVIAFLCADLVLAAFVLFASPPHG